ncbi:MliC family protein [Rubellimicrobium arenae]|uniref:MliC family protein n=1 Tax=Rubellimicrobium arenae TaxID=2817372 RepID=UPI001B3015C7|nr:MliC family protein [Rubellimicrobium arenae]
MRRLIISLAALGALAACADLQVGSFPAPPDGSGAPTPSEVAGAAIPPRGDTINYLCANGQVVQAAYPGRSDDDDVFSIGRPLSDRSARIYIDGRSYRMVQASSANGVRYIGGGYQWWRWGLDTASLAPLAPGESLASAAGTECRSGG